MKYLILMFAFLFLALYTPSKLKASVKVLQCLIKTKYLQLIRDKMSGSQEKHRYEIR